MIRLIVLMLLVVSCATVKEAEKDKNEYLLILKKDAFKAEIVKSQEKVKFKTALFDSDIVLKEILDVKNSFAGDFDSSGKYSTFQGHKEVFVSRLMLLNYYGNIAYYILTDLKSKGLDDAHPECPVETEYLTVIELNKTGFVLYACLVPI